MWSAKSTGHTAAAWPFVVAEHVDIFFLQQINRTWECGKKKTNINNDDYKRHAVLGKWRNQWLKEIKGKKKKIKRWACGANLWRMKWACVYLSSPIDHHLKQEERGRETWIQFNTLLHCRRRHSSSGGAKALASDMGWGFFSCLGGAYVPLANTSWNIKGSTNPIFWFLIRYLRPEDRGIDIFFIFLSYTDYIFND